MPALEEILGLLIQELGYFNLIRVRWKGQIPRGNAVHAPDMPDFLGVFDNADSRPKNQIT